MKTNHRLFKDCAVHLYHSYRYEKVNPNGTESDMQTHKKTLRNKAASSHLRFNFLLCLNDACGCGATSPYIYLTHHTFRYWGETKLSSVPP